MQVFHHFPGWKFKFFQKLLAELFQFARPQDTIVGIFELLALHIDFSQPSFRMFFKEKL
jgi:hypothetical protein